MVFSPNDETRPINVYCNLKSAQWSKDSSFSLDSIVFNANPGDLICIVGSIGSGKSSLLQTLIGEITFYDGDIQLNGSFCYVPQESCEKKRVHS